jgi:hypothetical protein
MQVAIEAFDKGEHDNARQSCEAVKAGWESEMCLALVYARLGRKADAEAQLQKIHSQLGEGAAYQYLEIYAQWGDVAKALEWLDTAVRIRDPGLVGLKTDPFVDPLRKEARFEAVLRARKLTG